MQIKSTRHSFSWTELLGPVHVCSTKSTSSHLKRRVTNTTRWILYVLLSTDFVIPQHKVLIWNYFSDWWAKSVCFCDFRFQRQGKIEAFLNPCGLVFSFVLEGYCVFLSIFSNFFRLVEAVESYYFATHLGHKRGVNLYIYIKHYMIFVVDTVLE